MSFRHMWKMVHLIHLYGNPGLSRADLFRAGIDCNPDTIQPLLQSLAIEEEADQYRLSSAAQKLLEVCTVANRSSYTGNVRVDYPHAFVIMPFGEPWSGDVFTRMIEPAVRAAMFECNRGDTTVRIGSLTTDIWAQIMKAGIIIADVSVPNVNVFYELGLTHALGKDALLLKQSGARVPADFSGAHYYEYDLNSLEAGRDALRSDLERWATDNHVPEVKALYSRLG
jgi:hypothetical protein